MVLSTTFALAQRHERRGRGNYNDNTDNMYARQQCEREEKRTEVIHRKDMLVRAEVVEVVDLIKRNGIINNFCARTTPRARDEYYPRGQWT